MGYSPDSPTWRNARQAEMARGYNRRFFDFAFRLAQEDRQRGRANSDEFALVLFCLVVVSGTASAVPCQLPESLGGHFFLFAFHAHEFEFALFGFDGGRDLLLDLGCHFFELR
jgi:hypothetical protein